MEGARGAPAARDILMMMQMIRHKDRLSGRVGVRGAALLFAAVIGACGVAFTLMFYVFGLILR